jgi:hypothetical protein
MEATVKLPLTLFKASKLPWHQVVFVSRGQRADDFAVAKNVGNRLVGHPRFALSTPHSSSEDNSRQNRDIQKFVESLGTTLGKPRLFAKIA